MTQDFISAINTARVERRNQPYEAALRRPDYTISIHKARILLDLLIECANKPSQETVVQLPRSIYLKVDTTSSDAERKRIAMFCSRYFACLPPHNPQSIADFPAMNPDVACMSRYIACLLEFRRILQAVYRAKFGNDPLLNVDKGNATWLFGVGTSPFGRAVQNELMNPAKAKSKKLLCNLMNGVETTLWPLEHSSQEALAMATSALNFWPFHTSIGPLEQIRANAAKMDNPEAVVNEPFLLAAVKLLCPTPDDATANAPLIMLMAQVYEIATFDPLHEPSR